MNFLKQLIFKDNKFIINFDILLISVKLLLTLTVCWFLKGQLGIKLFWIMTIWIGLSMMIDVMLTLTASKIFPTLSLSKAEQQQYKITSNELLKYLRVSPRIRLFRNLAVILIVIGFAPSNSWHMAPLFGVIVGFAVIDPLCRKILGIKAPFIFESKTKSTYQLPISSFELHKNNPYFGGSDAWNATYHHRQDQNPPKL